MTRVPFLCPTCGYDLRGLVGPPVVTCPECGQPCRPNDAPPFERRPSPLWLMLLVLTPIVIAMFGLAAGLMFRRMGGPIVGLVVGGTAGFLWAYATMRPFVTWLLGRSHAGRPRPIATLANAVFALLVTALSFAFIGLLIAGLFRGLV